MGNKKKQLGCQPRHKMQLGCNVRKHTQDAAGLLTNISGLCWYRREVMLEAGLIVLALADSHTLPPLITNGGRPSLAPCGSVPVPSALVSPEKVHWAVHMRLGLFQTGWALLVPIRHADVISSRLNNLPAFPAPRSWGGAVYDARPNGSEIK